MQYRSIVMSMTGLALLAGVMGCETKGQTGALAGGAGGAALGAVIGHQSGHAGAGALIGGAVGAGGGYVVGNEMDKKDAKREAAARNDGYHRQTASGSNYRVTKQDVINWTMRDTRDEIIVDRIRASGTVFHLTQRDIQELRDNGVSQYVVDEMLATRR